MPDFPVVDLDQDAEIDDTQPSAAGWISVSRYDDEDVFTIRKDAIDAVQTTQLGCVLHLRSGMRLPIKGSSVPVLMRLGIVSGG